MAVKQIGSEFYSTLTSYSYTSRQAAEHYDNLEKRRSRAASEGDKLLESLSADQIKSLSLAMSAKIDEVQNRGYGQEVAAEWFEQNPEVISAGEAGHANGVAMNVYLKSQGREFPYSKHDLDNAYSALQELGVIAIDDSKRPKAKDPAPNENVSPLDAWRSYQRVI
jgi:hypothetical protein